MLNKSLKFRKHLEPMVLSGKKDVTWRINDEKNIAVGDIIDLINWNTNKKFGEAKVLEVREKPIGQFDSKDFEGHEEFNSRRDMYRTYRKYYGDWINGDTVVKIIKFKLLE